MRYFLVVFLLLKYPVDIISLKPVKWTFSAKRTTNNAFEIKLAATVNQPWRIYSQSTPKGGPLPTTIKFNKNPFIILKGKINEAGNLVKKYEPTFGINVKYFNGNVEFTQIIQLKIKAKTFITGTVEYMACTEEKCLKPTKEDFSIVLEN